MSKLAIFGGTPVRKELFTAYNTIGNEEVEAVVNVLRSGVLSKFLGCWHPDFYGGPTVQTFEKVWAEKNMSKFAIAVNSNTSGIMSALGAAGIKPGDEVITSPYTMSASASACLFWGGIPMFADIDPDSFNITAKSISERITSKTKAIVVPHIFGKPADMEPIMKLANEKGVIVIEDCAQVPFTKYKGRFVGNLGHMGVFSLNYHKHIHTGEGGVITTNDENFSRKCQLIRNHAEAVVEDMGIKDLTNMWGGNFRLPEIEAAIGLEQIKKADALMVQRHSNASYLIKQLSEIKYLDTCNYDSKVDEHAYYVQPFKYIARMNSNLHRSKYLKALSAEIPSSYLREDDRLIGGGYIRPLYLQPLYQKKAFNTFGRNDLNYEKGLCPIAEEMHFNQLISTELMRPSMTKADLDQVVEAFLKVDQNIAEIVSRQNEL